MIPREDASLLERMPAAIFWLVAGAIAAAIVMAPLLFLSWLFVRA